MSNVCSPCAVMVEMSMLSGDAAKRPGRLLFGPPKTSSADSILAMFRSFSSTSAMNGGLGSSSMMSPSTTPTASSPQDDIAGSDESSTATPISTSSGQSDSPPLFTRRHTIQVTLDFNLGTLLQILWNRVCCLIIVKYSLRLNYQVKNTVQIIK